MFNFRASEYRAKLAIAMLSAAENHVNNVQISKTTKSSPQPPSEYMMYHIPLQKEVSLLM